MIYAPPGSYLPPGADEPGAGGGYGSRGKRTGRLQPGYEARPGTVPPVTVPPGTAGWLRRRLATAPSRVTAASSYGTEPGYGGGSSLRRRPGYGSYGGGPGYPGG